MTTSSLRRSVKNIVNNYTEAEIKVREATSNDQWGPSGSLMMEIAELTFNVVAFTEVMGIIWKRMNDHGKNWRHVYKALTLLDYLVKTGSERVTQHCKENIHAIQTLRDFQYIDRDGQDLGLNVREKAKQLVSLLQDNERLKQERAQAQKTRQRMAQTGSVTPRTSQPSTYGRSGGSTSSYNLSPSPTQLAPDLEQARPQTSGEEELQLQLALAMSREENEKPPPPVDIDEQTQLQIAMSLSKEDAKKPPPPVPLDMDEETQLQIALRLSKEEHQQEERNRQGDESLLQKALEESKREMEAKAGGSAILDLMDIFATVPGTLHEAKRWDPSEAGGQAQAAGPLRIDPWDSLEPASSNRGISSTWAGPSSLHTQHWENRSPLLDPWEAPQNAASPVSSNQTWHTTPTPATGTDPFSPLKADIKGSSFPVKSSLLRPGSPTDGDLFDDAMDGGQVHVNGRNEGSPELFDLSCLGEGLAEPISCVGGTSEAFLGPAAASLVNLDSLIVPNSAPKNLNPFLTGLSAPSVSNPFQSEQPRLTLNQMRPSSTSPASTSLQYSSSMTLPASSQPLSLPSSLTQPSEIHINTPAVIPQPQPPVSSISKQPGQPDQSQNPFL